MDYWNVSQGNNWGPTSSVLAFDTEDPVLIGMARALAGGVGDDFVVGSGRATFRIGGSTADMTDYAKSGARPAPATPSGTASPCRAG